VLVTGLNPFDGESIHPGWLPSQRLRGEVIVGHRIVANATH
jgi:pyrrolidone-carboxylate peptidase